ncbi:MAG TPA: CarD family transcriptional regulator [Anaerolineae bacterium]|jgi:CarD family transcriptional regulator
MLFNVGDFIVHPVYGVGHLVKIEERQFSKEAASLYYQISWPKRQVWIPVAAQKAGGLRLVTARRELDRYRTVLKGQPTLLSKNYYQRRQELLNCLDQGSFQSVCEVVRDLTARSRHKRLSRTDGDTLRQTRQALCHEWATAAGLSRTEASQEIDALLLVTEPTSPA